MNWIKWVSSVLQMQGVMTFYLNLNYYLTFEIVFKNTTPGWLFLCLHTNSVIEHEILRDRINTKDFLWYKTIWLCTIIEINVQKY